MSKIGEDIERLVDDLALADFADRHGSPQWAPLVVVIPAYDEADNIEGVLAQFPSDVAGVGVAVLVVVDGSPEGVGGKDLTAERVVNAGHFACVAPVNRGQGAALRLGYRLAARHGARWVATVDADGQYAPGDLAGLLAPVVAGEADFVQGSRRLGSAQRDDPVRLAGVYFFSWLISVLTGRRVTDSSNGMRVMTIEVVETVPLTEDQYHAAGLLVGAIRRGFRVVERPVRVSRRSGGGSKKAPNLVYGVQYARVILTTVWRDRRLPRADHGSGTRRNRYRPLP